MALIVNTNMAALNAQKNAGINNRGLAKSLERLSSGLRINRAADDAAGLAIATKFGAQVRGMNQAIRNANNAISLVQTAEGGINNLTNILQRLRELSVQSSSDDNTTSDRTMLTSEADNLIAEFTRIANTTEFNTMALLDGTFSGRYFQVGSNYAQQVTFDISDARGKSIGGRAEYNADVADGVTTATNANFGGSELKINGYGVAATSSSDDQYSVLEISSSSLVTVGSAASYDLMINNTSVNIVFTTSATAASIVDTLVSAINAAGITNVSAYTIGSTWALRATKGTDIELAVSTAGGIAASAFSDTLSYLGLGAVPTMFGSVAASGSDVANYNGQSSALAKAVAINAIKSNTQVTATTQKNTVTGSSAVVAGSIASGDVYINGVNIGAVTVTASDSTGALVSAINAQTSSTGVTASTDANGKLVLTASDGRNISVTTKDTTTKGILNLTSGQYTNGTAIFRSTVRLNSENEISLTGTLADLYEGTNDYTKTTDTSKSIAVNQTSFNVNLLKIDTQANAQAAVLTIDAALNDLNLVRSQIGAIQNRLEFTVANLEISSENMSASESRIKDADFAFETTVFTKTQILVQAGTSILAQANTLPQLALQLLR
ncbi:MAG: hypothetical protein M1443_02210 [Nitrospirae bacterium]|nr:hypothetical protein [Nitrospirota bacterium]